MTDELNSRSQIKRVMTQAPEVIHAELMRLREENASWRRTSEKLQTQLTELSARHERIVDRLTAERDHAAEDYCKAVEERDHMRELLGKARGGVGSGKR